MKNPNLHKAMEREVKAFNKRAPIYIMHEISKIDGDNWQQILLLNLISIEKNESAYRGGRVESL